MDNEKIEKLQQMIDESNHIVFFGGAGVSTESHIPDFRSTDGLYHQTYKYPPEVMVSHTFYTQHTEEFYDFYKNKMIFLDAKPNKAHLKLAEMERAGKLSAIVTQNIDGLHQAAGSKNVFELHGSVHRNYCQKCGKFFDVNYVVNAKGVPYCDECGGIIKPDVVLYEEGLDSQTINGAVRAISKADMLIIGGTSLVVYPAAGMIDYFKGKYLAVLNRDATSRDKQADLCITDPIGEVLGRIRYKDEEKRYDLDRSSTGNFADQFCSDQDDTKDGKEVIVTVDGKEVYKTSIEKDQIYQIPEKKMARTSCRSKMEKLQ